MDEEFLHLFEESPALRLMRGRLGSFVGGFFLKTFKQWGVVEASEEELGATLAEHIEQMRELEDFDAPKRLPQEYLDEWCDENHRYLTKVYDEEKEAGTGKVSVDKVEMLIKEILGKIKLETKDVL